MAHATVLPLESHVQSAKSQITLPKCVELASHHLTTTAGE